MSVWEQVVDLMNRTYTPVQAATTLAIYVLMVLGGVVLGWLLHKIRGQR